MHLLNRRQFMKAVGLAGLSGLLPGTRDVTALSLSDRQPNILFLAVDDLKPLLGCYGTPLVKSPHIDRLAATGTVFLNNHCQQAVCGPSRASLLTGLRPDTTRVWDLQTRMRDVLPDVLTLPQYFKAQGYETVGMGKIFDGRCCDGWGSQDTRSWTGPFVSTGGRLYADPDKAASKPTAAQLSRANRPATECADVADDLYQDGQLAVTGVRELKRLAKQDRPFFLGVGFKKPHLPFCAPKKYWDLYEREQFHLPAFQKHSEQGPDIAYHNWGELRTGYTDIPARGPMTRDKQLELIHGYHACVSYVDAQIGRLLDELRAQGLEQNTVVVLWGDHGWHLGDHDLWCKHSNFEQATRSTLIMRTPGVSNGGHRVKAPTEFVDIFPTLCDLAGLTVPAVLQGTSLKSLCQNPEASVKAVAVSQYPRSLEGKPVMGYAYRSDRYRYVQWIQKDYRKGDTTGPVVARELYDYQVDPNETRNRVDDPALRDIVTWFEERIGPDIETGVMR